MLNWKKAKGFSTRYLLEIAEYSGYKFKVTDKERIDHRYRKSKFFLAYIDNDYLGYAESLQQAKLICHLTAQEISC